MSRIKTTLLSVSSGLGLILGGMANAASIKPHLAFIDVNYVDSDQAGTGYSYRMQLPVKEGVYVIGSRTQWEDEQQVEQQRNQLGGGFYWDTMSGARMYLGYAKVDFSQGGVEQNDLTQYSLGWRSRSSRELEWVVEVNQTDFSTAGIDKEGYIAGVHYYLFDTFALTAETRRWREQDSLFIGFRFTSGH